MFVQTRSSAPKRFAKFRWQTRMVCHKKVGKVIAKLESDRLYQPLKNHAFDLGHPYV